MTVTALPAAVGHPDEPAPVRWVPTRAGLLNVWRYYDETLEFAGGRLLLRGPNGSGKSKALELLLPFLLDANLRAQRLSTFGTAERTMHWNLMGQGAVGVTRVGYVWIEFHRPGGPDDEPRWFTAGARLQASTRTTTVTADYFTTGRRIGEDLRLTTDAGVPLSRPELTAVLGEHGTRHDHAAGYRATVRHTLFPGMSEQRYDALILALLQLRTPKLSQRLDPALLSTLLSRALPPLGEGEVADLAEGFERLDRQRERLARLDEEATAAAALADRQADYARRVLRAGAATLISATSEMDRCTRAARTSEEQQAEAESARVAAEARAEELRLVRADAGARLEALQDSDAYREGAQLDDLRRRLGQAREGARRAGEVRGGAERTAATDDEAAQAARTAHDRADGVRAERLEEALRAGREAGLEAVVAQVRAGADRGLVRAAVQSRRTQIGEVRRHLAAWESAVGLRASRETDLDRERAGYARADAAQTEAGSTYTTALDTQRFRLEQWVRGTREIAAASGETGLDTLVDALLDAAESEPEVLGVLADTTRGVDREIDLVEADARRRASEAAARRDAVALDRDRVARETDLPPEPPPTRDADRSRRTLRDGAPLWRLVSFATGVDDVHQAAVEAALQASGLLDAWVGPDGSWLPADGHDTEILRIAPAPGSSLLEVLVPEPDAPVPVARLRDLLGSIAYSDDLHVHPAVVSADGRFRLASLSGSWAKPSAAHIGAAARERARRARLAELDEELAELDAVRATAERDADRALRRRARLRAELDARPAHRELDGARTTLGRADAALAAADTAVRDAVARRGEAESAVGSALRALTAHAAEHGLPADRDALDLLDQALTTCHGVTRLWMDADIAAGHARERAESATEQARRSRDVADERAEEAGAAEDAARNLHVRLETVEQTVGAQYREVLAEIGRVRDGIAEAEREGSRVTTLRTELAEKIGRLQEARDRDRARRDEAVTARDTAAARFRGLWRLGLAAEGGMSEDELVGSGHIGPGTRVTLDLARAVAAASSVSHDPRHVTESLGRLQETLHTSRDTLGTRADLTLGPATEDLADPTVVGDVPVLRVVLDGRTLGARALARAVDAEARRSRHDITEAERELFDTTLTGETRRHLASRLREAEALKDTMNERLEGVRTASNVAVRLRWEVADDAPTGTAAARRLLLRDPTRLDADDRAALHRFFRDRIDAARAEGTAGSWEDQLTEVFDYTRWHQFTVELDRGEGHDGPGWQKLTKRLHGALSGGEKAIALHLPLFAAVAAYYESVPSSPRLILLDEVFVGVDEINRGQVFGLLAALGLDLVLTSDHEWCAYREIDAIAVHQLLTGADDADDAVTTARWVWNGRTLEEA